MVYLSLKVCSGQNIFGKSLSEISAINLMGRFSIEYRIAPDHHKPKVIGLMRIRNESLILEDTLSHFSSFVDFIICLDDCSKDQTVNVLRKSKNVAAIICNQIWRKDDRVSEETVHRQLLLDIARRYSPEWLFYSDCDERFVGGIKDFLYSTESRHIDGIRISLFDAYLTPSDNAPYERGRQLLNFRRFFGPERRDIMMIWRNRPDVNFVGLDAREPAGVGKSITKFYCQHYGKSLSVQHWEETCDYYRTYFPEPYRTKWYSRKGKAIHLLSDFGRPLLNWEAVIKNNFLIHPV